MNLINALGISRKYAKSHVQSGDIVADATMGRGRDTLLLSQLVGDSGLVYAFDVQEEAIRGTQQLLDKNDCSNAELIKDTHENMEKYINPGLSCVMFNLGYLPGGNHQIHTKAESSIAALKAAMRLIVNKGIILIVIYHGGDTGYEEKDQIIKYCQSIDQKIFTVEMTSYINQKGDPPIFICIQKN